MLETRDPQGLSAAPTSPRSPPLDHADLGRDCSPSSRTEGFGALAEEGITRDTGRVEHALDIRYVGQEYTLTIPLHGAGEPLERRTSTEALADALPRSARDALRPRQPRRAGRARRRPHDGARRPRPRRAGAAQHGARGRVPAAVRGRSSSAGEAVRGASCTATTSPPGAVVEGPAIDHASRPRRRSSRRAPRCASTPFGTLVVTRPERRT